MNKIKIAKKLIKLAKNLVQQESTLMSDANIKKQLQKIHIKEYLPFKKIHEGEWMSFPINRNADLPDIYVHLDDGKLIVGYSFIDENKLDYHGNEQNSLPGMLEELSILKLKINEIVVNIKNEKLDQNQQKDNQQEQNSLDESLDEQDDESLDEQDDESLDESLDEQ